MGCGSSSDGVVYGRQYPVRAKRTDFKMVNKAQHQHQPYYTSPRQHPQGTYPNQNQSFQQQQQQQRWNQNQQWADHQRPVASVQPQKQVNHGASSSIPQNSKDHRNVRHVEVTPKILKYYVELELSAREWETRGIGKTMKLKQEQLVNLQRALNALENKHAEAVRKTEKERSDVVNLQKPESVREFLQDQATYDEHLSVEQEEYLEALNLEELLLKELETARKQKERLEEEISMLRDDVEDMNKVYGQQDQLLYSIFQGKYGSELENQLELELDGLLEKKERVGMAKTRWHNGLMLLRHAYQQLAFSVNRWKEMGVINTTQTAIRWQYATETRNNLLAAQQNITSAQRYLNTIDFPYCKSDEMETLNRAIANIYTDMQSIDRYTHAQKCYTITYQRCAALIQWFDAVINGTIKKDLDQVNKEVYERSKKLRRERLRLIKDMCVENMGPDVQRILDEAEQSSRPVIEVDDDDTLAVVPDQLPAEEVIGDMEGDSVPAPASDETIAPVAAPTPISQTDLAPPPSSGDLFGNIEDIKKQHEEKMEEFNKAQVLNKARQEQGMQEKLAARRQRRVQAE